MRLGKVTQIETICFFNWNKSALTFITERLRKRESTKLTCISGWLILNLNSPMLLLLLGIVCRSHEYVYIDIDIDILFCTVAVAALALVFCEKI